MENLNSSAISNSFASKNPLNKEELAFTKKTSTDLLGSFELYKNKLNGMPVIKLTKVFDNKKVCEDEKDICQNLMDIGSIKYINNIMHIDLIEISNFCSTFYELILYYRYVGNNLKKEID